MNSFNINLVVNAPDCFTTGTMSDCISNDLHDDFDYNGVELVSKNVVTNTDSAKIRMIYDLCCEVLDGIEEDDGNYTDVENELIDELANMKNAYENL